MDYAIEFLSVLFGVDKGAVIAILVALLLGLLTIAFLLLLRREKRKTVLLCGPPGAGKTLLFSRLVSGNKVDTYTSMKENRFEQLPVGKSLAFLVDIPGSERLRGPILRQCMKEGGLCGIVFLIDSVLFSEQARDVAQLLYDLLVATAPFRHCQILIACNKQDMDSALSEEEISRGLIRELGLLHESRLATLAGESDESQLLRFRGGEFQWEELERKIQFCQCALADSEEFDMEPIHNWLRSVV